MNDLKPLTPEGQERWDEWRRDADARARSIVPVKDAYPDEAALCASFAEAVGGEFDLHPEVAGWDFVAVTQSGVQVGIEAKMRPSMSTLVQVDERSGNHAGVVLNAAGARKPQPDHALVLAPRISGEFRKIAMRLGIICIEPVTGTSLIGGKRVRTICTYDDSEWSRAIRRIAQLTPSGRSNTLKLPPVIPPACELVAGLPSPSPLTDWRQRALEACWLMDTFGLITSAQMKALGQNPSRWKDSGWLVPSAETSRKRAKEYLRGTGRTRWGDVGSPPPDAGWEETKALMAEACDWRSKWNA